MLGDSSRRPPECAFARGMFEVTLHFERSLENQAADMRISQADDWPLAPLVPDPDYPLALLVPEPDEPLAPLVPIDAPPLNNNCTGQARWSGWVLESVGQ